MPETIAFGSNFETLCRENFIPNINSAFWLNYIKYIINLLGKCFVHAQYISTKWVSVENLLTETKDNY